MALNIFPRRKEPAEPVAAPESTPSHPEPSPEALEQPRDQHDGQNGHHDDHEGEGEQRKRTRRGTRGGRGRSRSTEAKEAAVADHEDSDEQEDEVAAAPEEAPAAEEAPRKRAPRRTAAATAEPEEGEEATPAPKSRAKSAAKAEATDEEAETPAPRTRARRTTKEKPAETGAPSENGVVTADLLRAIENQGRQLEQLVRLQEELSKKVSDNATHPAVRPPRVGVFVDAANIELACDRLRARFDWGKVLNLLTKDRELVRAMAYSPVHDDPNVSMETQRFAEPFLDKGFKIVTKPLKRFADGTVKANVDIELTLDIVTMLDRLDVVCIVSGDGDFQPLVEFIQRQGVRCEVVAVGSSTASNLRTAADLYIDLQQKLREVRA